MIPLLLNLITSVDRGCWGQQVRSQKVEGQLADPVLNPRKICK